MQAAGYRLGPVHEPAPGDVMVIWNRYGGFHESATAFERVGGTVVVAENGYLGKAWNGGDWYALAKGHHSGAGKWHVGGSERWDAIGDELQPWRDVDGPPLILGQRGIGEPGIAAPRNWAESVLPKVGGRIREHPGKHKPRVSLEADLATVSCAVTWNSGAALLALMAGVPVFHAFERWIGAAASQPIAKFPQKRLDDGRLEMFRRLAWSVWTLDEIAAGIAFDTLLHDR